MGPVKSMREGNTGLGYTFECLLKKKEDHECKPDYKSVEIKCKLGYTKMPLALFTYTPLRNGESAINYIYDTYKFHRYNNPEDIEIFSMKLFSRYTMLCYGYTFKLLVDYEAEELIMQAYYEGEYVEDVCMWPFKTLKEKLVGKLSTLAIVYGYPYRKSGEVYYRYLKMDIYKLKGFYKFLSLIEEDKIFVYMYLKEGKDANGNFKIINPGVCFKMRQEYVSELFTYIRV